MKKFNIEYNDACELERLLKININIDTIYKKLKILEIENKKETDEYVKHIKYLSLLIEGEKDFFKEVNITSSKALTWLKILLKAQENSSNTNFGNRVVDRIINSLLCIISNDYNFLINLSTKELENLLKILGLEFKENTLTKEQIVHCIILKSNIEKDIKFIYLSFLEEQIKIQKSKVIKEKLIISKYYMIYANKDLETLILTNNFIIENTSYTSSKITKDILNIEDSIYDFIINLIGSSITIGKAYELLEINDLDYNEKEKKSTSIICQCLLKAAILFVDDITLNNIKKDLQNFIENPEYQIIHENSNISKTIINNCLNNINKSKIQILSLK